MHRIPVFMAFLVFGCSLVTNPPDRKHKAQKPLYKPKEKGQASALQSHVASVKSAPDETW